MTRATPPGLRGAERPLGQDEERVQVQRFINALNQAMLVQRVSQRGLCELMGITVGTLTKYLRGEVLPLKVGTGIQACLADVLGVTLDALLHYYRSGEYATVVSIDDVESWIRSEAGQEDLPALMASLQAAGERWIAPQAHQAPARTRPLEPYSWPIEEIEDSGVSQRFLERLGLTKESLEALRDYGKFDDELVEAFSVACNYEIEAVREAFAKRVPIT